MYLGKYTIHGSDANYVWVKIMVNVGKYTSRTDPLGEVDPLVRGERMVKTGNYRSKYRSFSFLVI